MTQKMQPSKNFKKNKRAPEMTVDDSHAWPKKWSCFKKEKKKKALAQNSSWHGNVLSRYQMVCEYSNFTSHSLGYHCFSWAVSKENLPATLAHFSGIQLVPILCTSVMTPRFILWSAWSIEENQSCLVKNLIFFICI